VSQRATFTTSVCNRLGLHARPAMAFVDTAMRFTSTVTVRRTDGSGDLVDGKSIMQMMMLAATKGTKLEVIARGADADAACEALRLLIERGFDEE